MSESALYAHFCSTILAEVPELESPNTEASTLRLPLPFVYFIKFLFQVAELLILRFIAVIHEGRMYVAQPRQPSGEKTRDRNRGPRAKAHFHFNQSACWFSWLWALYKQNQMAAPGTGWGTETLGREMREETYREGDWEIKVSLSWPNTVKLSGDQPLQRTAAEDGRRPKTGCFSSLSPTVSVALTEHAAGLKGADRAGRREVFYYPEWRAQMRKVARCLFELERMVNNRGVTNLWMTCLES